MPCILNTIHIVYMNTVYMKAPLIPNITLHTLTDAGSHNMPCYTVLRCPEDKEEATVSLLFIPPLPKVPSHGPGPGPVLKPLKRSKGVAHKHRHPKCLQSLFIHSSMFGTASAVPVWHDMCLVRGLMRITKCRIREQA